MISEISKHNFRIKRDQISGPSRTRQGHIPQGLGIVIRIKDLKGVGRTPQIVDRARKKDVEWAIRDLFFPRDLRYLVLYGPSGPLKSCTYDL
jgi:hypothetical protein